MNRTHRPVKVWTMACLTVVSVVLVVPWILWQSQASTPLNIMIIDKSKPDLSYVAHKGLVWLLNQQKIVQQTGERYRYEEDYYGYDTQNDILRMKRPLPDEVTDTDLIYLTSNQSMSSDDPNEHIQGQTLEGLTIYDAQKICEAANKGVSIVAESSALWNITSDLTREQLYPILGMRSSGWQGRSVSDLQNTDEVPQRVRMNYERSEKKNWSFHGAGIVLAHEDGQVLVLQKGRDVKTEDIQVSFTKEGAEWSGVTKDTHYSNWFDVIVPEQNDFVLAWYGTDLTKEGQQKLKDAGIPPDFPALIRHDDHNRSYYMAGTFGEMKHYSFWRRIKGWEVLRNKLTPDEKGIPDLFYWKVYVPVMKKILQEVQTGRQPWQ
ncbi:hypothetical protein JNUCC31_17225 [Paenibacillus sp. JNUCC31]|uniref:hypothetical protein n=1 Tax=Paenibacillus sp. JNUCC-31 TaxID=2777983 RepID=UPI001785C3F8|nr:hypothetical protein [Paenibacillus sp. JNUCC-31]QOS76597.1 hypothetical protein JNUCC31_17225 [Paenibacillus sp. JNUCC-31]